MCHLAPVEGRSLPRFINTIMVRIRCESREALAEWCIRREEEWFKVPQRAPAPPSTHALTCIHPPAHPHTHPSPLGHPQLAKKVEQTLATSSALLGDLPRVDRLRSASSDLLHELQVSINNSNLARMLDRERRPPPHGPPALGQLRSVVP